MSSMDQSLRLTGATEPASPPGLFVSPLGGASRSRLEAGVGWRTMWEDAMGTEDGVECDVADVDDDEEEEVEESLITPVGGEILEGSPATDKNVSFISLFIFHSFLHSCLHSFLHSFLHFFIYFFISSFISSFLLSFLHSFLHSFFH